jgi:multidrug resistance efflux pump
MGYLTNALRSASPRVEMSPPMEVQGRRVQAKAARLRSEAAQARAAWPQARGQLERLAIRMYQLGIVLAEAEDRRRAGTTEPEVSLSIPSTPNTRCTGDSLTGDR